MLEMISLSSLFLLNPVRATVLSSLALDKEVIAPQWKWKWLHHWLEVIAPQCALLYYFTLSKHQMILLVGDMG
jgi:hypothetical protein